MPRTTTLPRTPGDRESALFEVVDSIRRINQTMRLSAREVEAREGITGAQLFLLQQLAASGPVSLNDLAARTYTRHSSTSEMVARLVDGGLVARRGDPRDARRVSLSLTTRGRAVVRRTPDSPFQRLVERVQRLPARQLASLATSLRALTTALDGDGAGDARGVRDVRDVRRARAAAERSAVRDGDGAPGSRIARAR